MCLRTACYEYEQRIKNLEAQNAELRAERDNLKAYINRKQLLHDHFAMHNQIDELKQVARFLWLAQFSPLTKEDKKELNALMRKHGIEVYP